MKPEEAIFEAKRAAVNAIYFDDGWDFGTALWDVVRYLDPELCELLQEQRHAAFLLVNPEHE